MSRATPWAVAALGLALLLFLCVRGHGPQIEAELMAGTTAALGDDALRNVDVTLSGRDVVLQGQAGSLDERDHLGELAARVHGVRTVDNRLRVAAEPASRGFELRDGSAGLVVAGTVPDVSARTAMLERLTEAFPGRQIVDSLDLDADAKASWQAAALGVVGVLGQLPAGALMDVALVAEPSSGLGSGGVLALRGRVLTASIKAQAEGAARASVDAPWRLRSELTVSDAAGASRSGAAGTQLGSAAPGHAGELERQAELRDVFPPNPQTARGSSATQLETGTSYFTDASRGSFTQPTSVPPRVEPVTVETQRHTDEGGSTAAPLHLAPQRADAVHRPLPDAGAGRTRLTVRGADESAPIA